MAPSILDNESQRIQQGRGNHSIASGYPANSEIQKQYTLAFSRSTSTPKSQDLSTLPPLKQSVASIPGSDKASTAQIFNNAASDLEAEEEETMAGQSTLRNIEKKYPHKASNSGKAIQVTKEVWTQILRDIKEAHSANTVLVKENKKLGADNTKFGEQLEAAAELKAKYEKLTSKKRGKGKNKALCRKDEQKEDVNTAISGFIKEVLFRTHKFALPGDALVATTKLVWEGIKESLKLDKGPNALKMEDFVEIYDSAVLSELSARRQYCQSRCKIAVDGWLDTHTELPTIQQIENVWDVPLPPEIPENETEEARTAREISEEQKAYEAGIELLVWWLDSFMPHAVGLDFWGPEIRCFHLMTDKTTIAGDPSGKEKVYVTVTSEAFAHVLYANCRDKWQATHEYVQQHTKKGSSKKPKVPLFDKKNESTWKFLNKWSNSRSGQVQGGGWSEEALDYFNSMKDNVSEFRQKEAENDFASYKLAQHLLRIANDYKLEENKEPVNAKKRKAAQSAEEPAAKKVEIIYLDE